MTAPGIAAPRIGGLRVAYQGEPGAYGEMAITRRWGTQATAVGAPTFADALALLGRGGTDFAAIPVWNSTIGDIQDTAVLLAHHASRVDIISELTVPIQHCLLGLPGATLGNVRYVGSHPTALAQCKRLFADRRHLQPCVAHDTAGAARELATLGGITEAPTARPASPPWFEPYRPTDPRVFATIAGGNVAAIYGLVVLAESVQDNPANATRFVIVCPRDGAQW